MRVVPPLERRLQLFTGKGGTGKTTLVAALALAHAARAKKPLVVELGHRASLARVLAVSAVGPEPCDVGQGVYATNLDVRHATEALVRRTLPSRVTARAMRSGPIRTFLDAAPGVGEVATLDRLAHFVDETDFDPILVDGDATGHTRMLFALHGVLEGLGVGGPLAAILDRISGVFASPALAAVHIATLPTSLATEETIELRDELRAGGRIALGHVLLGRVEGAELAGRDPLALEALEARLAPAAIASAVALLRVGTERAAHAVALQRRLAKHGITALVVPERAEGTLDRRGLEALGRELLEAEART